jgi:hypothetical protein
VSKGQRVSKKQRLLSGQLGRPIPLTGACAVCGERVRIKGDGNTWLHGKGRRKPDGCKGSGGAPKPGTVKNEFPKRKDGQPRSGSVRAISSGAFESNRRRH